MNSSTGSSATNAPPAVPVSSVTGPPAILDFDNLVPGARWRECYRIGAQLTDVTHGKAFTGHHDGLMTDVVIRSFLVSDDLRKRTWEEIQRAKSGGLLNLIEAVEGAGRRIEVTQAAPALTLREWLGQHKASQPEIESIVRQLSQALGNLHKNGVVHLNVRSDTIYVCPTEGALAVLLGGFETATLLQADGPVELSMDPFYAPPEAVGLYHFTREPGLRAWDWWSLGRVVQEVVLGRHILGHLLGRDVTGGTSELRARAENLLKEQEGTARAGAVELMPAMDRDLTTLLRGLLSGSRDGRWGMVEVGGWLRKEPVKDRYHLSRNERLFFWKDRAYTVPEAASFFARAEHWLEGEANILEPSNTATLAHFLGSGNAHKKTRERFDVLLKQGEAPALQQLPKGIVSNVVMAVVLKFLAGPDAPLLLRGHRIDETCLRQLLRPEAQPGGLNTVQAFTACTIVQQIEQFDAETGRFLGGLGRLYEAALALTGKHNWLLLDDTVGKAALMDLCLEPESILRTKQVEMHKVYVCSRDPALDELFKKPEPTRTELVVIAFTLRDPAKFGYVSHGEWNGDRYRLLAERGEQLTAAVLWLQLGRALKLGPLVFGRWRFLIPVWGVLALATAYVGQNAFAYAAALSCLAAVFVVRLIWFGFHRQRLQHHIPGSRPWTLRSGWNRCWEEAAAILKSGTIPETKVLLHQIRDLDGEIARLALNPAPQPISYPPDFKDTRVVSMVSWGLVFLLATGTAWRGVQEPPKRSPIDWVWPKQARISNDSKGDETKPKTLELKPVVTPAHVDPTDDVAELAKAKRMAEKAAESLIKMSWPFKMPSEAKYVGLHETLSATPAQSAAAEEMARVIESHYEQATINAIVAVQVPTDKDVGLMLYDGRAGKISDKKVYVIGYVPFARSWIELDGKRVLFFVEQ
jgi:hypothetical protein